MSAGVSSSSWECRRLRDAVTKLVDGSHNPPAKQEAGKPMLSARNVEQGRIVFDDFRFINDDAFVAENARTRIAPGDVLLTIVGTIGRSAVVPEGLGPFTLQRSVAVLTPKPDLLSKFLSYQLQSPRIQRHFNAHARGTAQKGVYLKTLGETPLFVPSVGEQRDIVAEIEKQFSRLDEAVAGLRRVKANLNRYKAAVLKAAVEGRLVPTEANLARRDGRSYETGAQLLQRILETRRSQWQGKGKYKEPAAPETTALTELPEGWLWASVDSLSTRVSDGVHKKPNYLPTGIPFVTVKNLTAGPGISFENLNYISEEDHVEFCKRTKPERGDILISKDGTLGVVRLIDSDRVFSIFVSVALVKPVTKELSQYLAIAFESPVLQRQMVPKGSGLQHIHLEDLRADCVPLPPFPEQHRIVAEVDRLLSIAREAEAEVETNLKRAQGLRQAILQTAFSSASPERQ